MDNTLWHFGSTQRWAVKSIPPKLQKDWQHLLQSPTPLKEVFSFRLLLWCIQFTPQLKNLPTPHVCPRVFWKFKCTRGKRRKLYIIGYADQHVPSPTFLVGESSQHLLVRGTISKELQLTVIHQKQRGNFYIPLDRIWNITSIDPGTFKWVQKLCRRAGTHDTIGMSTI